MAASFELSMKNMKRREICGNSLLELLYKVKMGYLLRLKLHYIETHLPEVRRLVSSFFVMWLFIIECAETDKLSPEKIIVASSVRFGTEQQYSMYITPLVLFSLPIIGCIYFALLKIEKYIILESKWRRIAVFIATLMAFWHTLNKSFYYVVSSKLFIGGGIITIFLMTGYYIVFYYFICILLSCFQVKPEKTLFKYSQFDSLRKQEGISKGICHLWILYLICWLPRLILSYPMAFDWDMGTMFDTALNGVEHGYPVAQVMILRFLYQFGDTVGSAMSVFFAYMCIKYLYSTFFFALLMAFFQKRTGSRQLWFTVLGITLVCPIFQSWSIYITKDSNYTFCFAGVILLVCIFILDKESLLKHKIFTTVVFAVLLGGVYLFRGNGVYIDILFLGSGILSFMNIDKMKYRALHINYRRLVIPVLVLTIGIAGGILFYIGQGHRSENIERTEVENNNSTEEISFLKKHASKYLKFYIQRVTGFFRLEAISRYSVVIQKECPDEVKEILEDDLKKISSIEYKASYGEIPDNLPIDVNKQEELMLYIVKNEPILFIESIIAKIYGYFDFSRFFSSTYGSGIEYGTYNMYGLDKFWENETEWQIRGDLLRASYDRFRLIPVLHMTCNTGLYVWLLIIVSIYLLVERGRKVFCLLAPCWLTLLGAVVSGYNAYMRLCLPFVFSLPILLLLCTVRKSDV